MQKFTSAKFQVAVTTVFSVLVLAVSASADTINVMWVSARDAAGNFGTDVITVTYSTGVDTVAPKVTITAPTSSSRYTTAVKSITLSGIASDNVGVTRVTWRNSRGGRGTAVGTTSWRIWNIPLYYGTNTLVVTARDAAGNTKTDYVTVNKTTR